MFFGAVLHCLGHQAQWQPKQPDRYDSAKQGRQAAAAAAAVWAKTTTPVMQP